MKKWLIVLVVMNDGWERQRPNKDANAEWAGHIKHSITIYHASAAENYLEIRPLEYLYCRHPAINTVILPLPVS